MAETTNSLRLVGVLSDIDPFTVTKVKRTPSTIIRKGETEANVLSDFYYFLVGEREDKKKTDKKTAIAEKQIAIEGADVSLSDTNATVVKEQSSGSDSGVLAMLGIVSVGAGLYIFSDDIQKKINELKDNFDESKLKGVVDNIKKLFDFDNIMSGMGIPSGGDISLSKEAIDPKEVYKYLTETKGIDPVHAMGMMANIMGESGFRPGAFVTDEKGLPTGGLFQHHDPVKGKGRFTEMTKFVGADWQKDWKKQIDFALSESESKQYLATPYATNVEAAGGFVRQFEKPKNTEQDIAKRVGFISGIEKKITSTTAISSPNDIGITDISDQGNFNFSQLEEKKGFIIHHTGGRGSAEDIMNVFKERNFPAQYIIDREGKVYRTLKPGMQGQHIKKGQGVGKGLSNANTEGVEIIANDDKDILPIQIEAAKKLSEQLGYKPNQIFGHGEVNPHKQETEGKTVVDYIRNVNIANPIFRFIPRRENISSINPPPTIVVQQAHAYVERKTIVQQLPTSESDNPPHRSA